MTSHTELVSKLLARTISVRRRDLAGGRMEPDPLCVEAADAITALERELDEARLAASVIEGICNEMYLELTDSQAQVERLKEALRIAEAVLRNADGFETTDDGRIPLHSPFTAARLARAALQVEESKG